MTTRYHPLRRGQPRQPPTKPLTASAASLAADKKAAAAAAAPPPPLSPTHRTLLAVIQQQQERIAALQSSLLHFTHHTRRSFDSAGPDEQLCGGLDGDASPLFSAPMAPLAFVRVDKGGDACGAWCARDAAAASSYSDPEAAFPPVSVSTPRHTATASNFSFTSELPSLEVTSSPRLLPSSQQRPSVLRLSVAPSPSPPPSARGEGEAAETSASTGTADSRVQLHTAASSLCFEKMKRTAPQTARAADSETEAAAMVRRLKVRCARQACEGRDLRDCVSAVLGCVRAALDDTQATAYADVPASLVSVLEYVQRRCTRTLLLDAPGTEEGAAAGDGGAAPTPTLTPPLSPCSSEAQPRRSPPLELPCLHDGEID